MLTHPLLSLMVEPPKGSLSVEHLKVLMVEHLKVLNSRAPKGDGGLIELAAEIV